MYTRDLYISTPCPHTHIINKFAINVWEGSKNTRGMQHIFYAIKYYPLHATQCDKSDITNLSQNAL